MASRFDKKHGALLLSHHAGDLEAASRSMEESYLGAYEAPSDYAQEITEETTEISENIRHYIDYDSMARDMEMGAVYLPSKRRMERYTSF
jgi:antirestriction protein